ncbi:MAG: S-methyl-5-thioribose-1-phosphate isomerase [Candidatus Krumholzibacteriia bacterium]
MILPTVDYRRGAVEIIDQTLLPWEERIVRLAGLEETAEAIRSLRVRGAPAIGIAAAYGMLVALENFLVERLRPPRGYLPAERLSAPRGYFFDRAEGAPVLDAALIDVSDVRLRLASARETLAATRPTAVNLSWALERVARAAAAAGSDPAAVCSAVAREAFAIHAEELEIEYAIGRNGAVFIRDGMNILTHCNAGGLATAGYGTALGVLYAAWEDGKRFHVYVDETRPLLQGARLTAWELAKRGIPHTLLCEGAAASLFAAGSVDAVVVGADRIAANGDVANKIGTLGLAVLCEKFARPLYVAAPWSTFDLDTASGRDIPIEERPFAEVVSFGGVRTAPDGTIAYNPAFDVTPASLITAIITDRGVLEAPNSLKINKLTAVK